MRVFTFISKNGDGLPLAQRVQDEGHRAVFYINNRSSRRVGNGLVEKSNVKEELISEEGKINESALKKVLHPTPDCVVFDMVGWGYGDLADKLKKQGIPVIGACAWGDRIELDRPYGAKVMKTMNINTPKTTVFTDYPKAIRFVEENNKAYVYKPSGNQNTTTTYVAEGADDMIGMLEYYSGIKEEFELQEKVDGIEVSSELWFNGKDVINVNHTMEEKSLMEGGKGPKAGCMGSVVCIGSLTSKLCIEGIGRMLPALKKLGYRGPIDLNTIVTKDKLYGLEFTARFGYDALFILLEMYKGRVNDFLYSIATGVAKTLQFKSQWGVGIDFVVPPYPLDIEPDLYKGVLMQGLNKHNLRHIWFYDVYKKGEAYFCSGNGGDLGTATARGDSIENYHPVRDAKRRVMRTISNLIIPDLMYRNDIGNRVFAEHKQLVDWGWL